MLMDVIHPLSLLQRNNMRKLIFFFSFLLFSCVSGSSKKEVFSFSYNLPSKSVGEFSFSSMGTLWRVVYTKQKTSFKEDLLQREILERVSFYDETFSTWSSESELKQIEKKDFSENIKSSELFLEALILGKELFEKTKGVFDPSRGTGNFSGLSFSRKELSFSFSKNPPTKLDFNGFVKGMAVSEVALLLYRSGLKDFYINAGNGNLAYRVSEAYKEDFPLLGKRFFPFGRGKVYFLSQSETVQVHGKIKHQHIQGALNQKVDSGAQVLCSLNVSESSSWIKMGGVSDAFSTALSLDKSLSLPKFCSYF